MKTCWEELDLRVWKLVPQVGKRGTNGERGANKLSKMKVDHLRRTWRGSVGVIEDYSAISVVISWNVSVNIDWELLNVGGRERSSSLWGKGCVGEERGLGP